MFDKTSTYFLRPFFVFFFARTFVVRLSIIAAFCIANFCSKAQQTDTAYQKVIKERTAKIVNNLGVKDASSFEKVQMLLMNQYFNLNAIHEKTKLAIAQIKSTDTVKTCSAAAIKLEEEKKMNLLKELHVKFIADLKQNLTATQIEQVKDGMTYNILQVTWKAYLEMLQKLTQAQKDKMYGWLVEARELAMDEGSSDKKHAVFGKYKGRINNYLSAEGYNMKQEGDDWAKRIQQAKDEKKAQN
jgi:hypothetical protein